MCPINHCKNNGKCVGNGLCACEKGFMGSLCEVPGIMSPSYQTSIIPTLFICSWASNRFFLVYFHLIFFFIYTFKIRQ